MMIVSLTFILNSSIKKVLVRKFRNIQQAKEKPTKICTSLLVMIQRLCTTLSELGRMDHLTFDQLNCALNSPAWSVSCG